MNYIERQLGSIVRMLSDESLSDSQLGNESAGEEMWSKWSHGVDLRKNTYYFRGEPSCNFSILPKIARPGCNMLFKEEIIRREMIRAFPSVFRSGTASPMEQLIVMQHFGVPTRLLDVTRNFLVALYFACQPVSPDQKTDEDGRVLVFAVSKLDPATYINGQVFREVESYNPFVKHMIGEVRDRVDNVPLRESSVLYVSDSKAVAEWCNPFILRSAYLSERQRVQSGHFLVFPNKHDGNDFTEELCNEPTPSGMIKIEKESKARMLKWLDLFFGINKMNLFPEDVDGGCRDIIEDIKKGRLI